MEANVVYFENIGKVNTDETLTMARQRADELGIKTIVVASSSGDTGLKALHVFHRLKVIVVTHYFGIGKPNTIALTEENRSNIEAGGGIILTASEPLSGIHHIAGSRHYGAPVKPGEAPSQIGSSIADIIGSTLGFFGRGMKVACEITLMAADAGLVRTDQEVIAIAGTRFGADTAIVVQPANTHHLYNLRVQQVICKPHL